MLKIMNDEDFIVSKTDIKGKITYCNEIFIEFSGYTEKELLGKPHNIIRHKEMPKAIFKFLWDNIQKKEEVFAYVLNKSKNEDEYWVFANITASIDKNNNIIGYYSVRRRPNEKALNEIIIPLYKEMLRIEKSKSVSDSFNYLLDILNEKGVSYEEFILNIQK